MCTTFRRSMARLPVSSFVAGALHVGSLVLLSVLFVSDASAQSFGIELHNTMMPASGGMAGASLTQPQDLLSSLNGNPSTLTQFRGSQFSFGQAWIEPTYRVTQIAPLAGVGVTPYSAKSGTPGSLIGNIGVTQDLSELGLPVTAGMGLVTNAGAGVDFRGVPESNGTSAQYLALDVLIGAGADVTDRLSVGASVAVGISYLDGPFVDVGGMVPDYALRGTLGANYWLGCDTTLGLYWQTRKRFTFDDAAFFLGQAPVDIDFDHPENFGLGIANRSLMDGCLLLAADVVYKRHRTADFLRALYDDQWVFLLGAQYTLGQRTRLRLGYAYNENPMRHDAIVTSIGGVPLPDGVPGLRYVQGQFASVSQHRVTAGVGVRDVLPGLDVDLFAGGMFENSDRLADTISSVEGYWVGSAITWRFGRGACQDLGVADSWCNNL